MATNKNASTTATLPANEVSHGTNEQAFASEVAAQAAITAQVETEYNKIVAARRSYMDLLRTAKPLLLSKLARSHGMSVNKMGRPAFEAWADFTLALVGEGITHQTFDRLCREALNAVGTHPDNKLSGDDLQKAKDKCVTGKARAKHGQSGVTLKITPPAAWAIKLE